MFNDQVPIHVLILIYLISELDLSQVHFDHCITTQTPTHLPYIDMVTSSIGMVMGGSGRGAKAADEIGNLAARLVYQNSE